MNDLYPFKFKYKDIKYLIWMHPKSSRKKNIYQQWLIDRFSSERLTKEVYFVTSINKKSGLCSPLLSNYEKVLLI
jgi:hypothetical protein